jgi:hypothetical protein
MLYLTPETADELKHSRELFKGAIIMMFDFIICDIF